MNAESVVLGVDYEQIKRHLWKAEGKEGRKEDGDVGVCVVMEVKVCWQWYCCGCNAMAAVLVMRESVLYCRGGRYDREPEFPTVKELMFYCFPRKVMVY